jgi:L-rhamnose isomerase
MGEIANYDALDRVLIGLDFFDASINRVAAWIIGTRNAQKALLWGLLQPHDLLKEAESQADYTKRLMIQEETKSLPFSSVWTEYCKRQDVAWDSSWYDDVMSYEQKVLSKRYSKHRNRRQHYEK